MDGNLLYHKWNLRLARAFTRLIRGSFRSFGRGSLIFFPNRIDNPGQMDIGVDVLIYSNSWINAVDQYAGVSTRGEILIGDRCVISHHVQITASRRITLGACVGIGKGSVLADHVHDYRNMGLPILYAPITEGRPITIQDEAVIMVNCVVAPGVTIGRHAFVGANSVILKDIPSFSLAAGNPARVIRRYDPSPEAGTSVSSTIPPHPS